MRAPISVERLANVVKSRRLGQIAPREAGALLERMVKDAEIILHGQRKAAYYTANKPSKT